MKENEKSNRYVKVIDSYTKSEISVGKEYLVYFEYDSEYFNCYRIVGFENGFREYNENTGLFKNNITNVFEQFNY